MSEHAFPNRRDGWLDGLDATQRGEINEFTTVRVTGTKRASGRWFFRRTPTTGAIRDADLVQRSAEGRLIAEWPIMRSGIWVAQINDATGRNRVPA